MLGVATWLVVASFLGVLIGRIIALRDRQTPEIPRAALSSLTGVDQMGREAVPVVGSELPRS